MEDIMEDIITVRHRKLIVFFSLLIIAASGLALLRGSAPANSAAYVEPALRSSQTGDVSVIVTAGASLFERAPAMTADRMKNAMVNMILHFRIQLPPQRGFRRNKKCARPRKMKV